MQVELGPGLLDYLLHAGSGGIMLFSAYVGYKVNGRLNRDESLRADYPPHRHINGSIVYPRDYEPAHVDKIRIPAGPQADDL